MSRTFKVFSQVGLLKRTDTTVPHGPVLIGRRQFRSAAHHVYVRLAPDDAESRLKQASEMLQDFLQETHEVATEKEIETIQTLYEEKKNYWCWPENWRTRNDSRRHWHSRANAPLAHDIFYDFPRHVVLRMIQELNGIDLDTMERISAKEQEEYKFTIKEKKKNLLKQYERLFEILKELNSILEENMNLIGGYEVEFTSGDVRCRLPASAADLYLSALNYEEGLPKPYIALGGDQIGCQFIINSAFFDSKKLLLGFVGPWDGRHITSVLTIRIHRNLCHPLMLLQSKYPDYLLPRPGKEEDIGDFI